MTEWLNQYAMFFALLFSVIFAVQFLMSISGFGETDIDVDAGADFGDSGFGWSDVLSFKGILHFLLGFSWSYALITPENKFVQAACAVLFGGLFIFILAYSYQLVFKLSEESKEVDLANELTGKEVTVYSWNNEHGTVVGYVNSKRYEFSALFKDTPYFHQTFLKNGDVVRIQEFLQDKRYVYIEIPTMLNQTLKMREGEWHAFEEQQNKKDKVSNTVSNTEQQAISQIEQKPVQKKRTARKKAESGEKVETASNVENNRPRKNGKSAKTSKKVDESE